MDPILSRGLSPGFPQTCSRLLIILYIARSVFAQCNYLYDWLMFYGVAQLLYTDCISCMFMFFGVYSTDTEVILLRKSGMPVNTISSYYMHVLDFPSSYNRCELHYV